MANKVFGIFDAHFQNFIEKINEFNKDKKVFATQTLVNDDGFYAVIYYDVGTKNYTNKPTSKQLYALKKLGIPDIDKLTFQEASKLIGEHKKQEEY